MTDSSLAFEPYIKGVLIGQRFCDILEVALDEGVNNDLAQKLYASIRELYGEIKPNQKEAIRYLIVSFWRNMTPKDLREARTGYELQLGGILHGVMTSE